MKTDLQEIILIAKCIKKENVLSERLTLQGSRIESLSTSLYKELFPEPKQQIKKPLICNRYYFSIGRSKGDPEKLVLPSIVFVNANHKAFEEVRHRGFMLCLGWWDFSIKIGLFF
jgi:hypothetical protein